MNFIEIKELIGLLNDSNIAYFELKNENDYMKIDKSMCREYINHNKSNDIESISNTRKVKEIYEGSLQSEIISSNYIDKKIKEENSLINNKIEEDQSIEYIKSPIVGTYYKSTSPTSDPFIRVGEKINKGDVVCIVEAMKLMNEISADFDCEIIDILGENGKMVEYGQPLLKVRRL